MSATTKRNKLADFKRTVWKHYRAAGRHDLPWRARTTPYRIVVSEVMLQQTQVSRVIGKFKEFMRLFPTSAALADAPLASVLRAWQGLGYNRRARYLHQAARISKGKYPKTIEQLKKLPGIGINTAGAILAYAYDQPVVFIETNIRRVFINEFFKGKKDVRDAALVPLIAACVANEKNPREWYWALMDYGTMLAKDGTLVNPNRRSKHYTVQSKFEGSRRQMRGKILKYLLAADMGKRVVNISKAIGIPVIETNLLLATLVSEGLLEKRTGTFHVA